LILPGAAGETGGLGVFLALIVAVGGVVLAVTVLVRLSLAVIAVANEGIGPVTQMRLMEACGNVEAACNASVSKLRSIEGIGAAIDRALEQSPAIGEHA